MYKSRPIQTLVSELHDINFANPWSPTNIIRSSSWGRTKGDYIRPNFFFFFFCSNIQTSFGTVSLKRSIMDVVRIGHATTHTCFRTCMRPLVWLYHWPNQYISTCRTFNGKLADKKSGKAWALNFFQKKILYLSYLLLLLLLLFLLLFKD